jgi:hypothetical protein
MTEQTAPIALYDILPLSPLGHFKVHFARWNNHDQPIDVLARSMKEWRGWQEYRPSRNDFNRPFIFSLAQYPKNPDHWLFGGIWEVKARHEDRYEVALSDVARNLVRRLVLKRDYRSRGTRVNMESHYDAFEVFEILREPYAGLPFEGFDDIELSFAELETIVRNNQRDWQAALEHIKGVYLITDTLTGKIYVGSAYGSEGIWLRWSSYVHSGHGGNVELRQLVLDPSLEYCRSNFRFALLEAIGAKEPDEVVLKREVFWKKVLNSRGTFGLNRN